MIRFTLLLLCLCPIVLFAQSGFGFKGGLVISDEQFDGDFQPLDGSQSMRSTNELYSLGIGFFYRKEYSDLFAIAPALEWKHKGFTRTDGIVRRDNITERLSLHFQTEWQLFSGFHLIAGPEFAVKVGQLLRAEEDWFRVNAVKYRNDIILNAGLRVDITKRVSAGLRYHHSLIPYDEVLFFDEFGSLIQTLNIKQRALSMDFYYLMPRE